MKCYRSENLASLLAEPLSDGSNCAGEFEIIKCDVWEDS